MSEVFTLPLPRLLLKHIRRPRFTLHPLWFSLVAAFLLTVSLNSLFLQQVSSKITGQYGLQTSLFLLLFLLNWLLLVLFSFKFSQKPVLLLLF